MMRKRDERRKERGKRLHDLVFVLATLFLNDKKAIRTALSNKHDFSGPVFKKFSYIDSATIAKRSRAKSRKTHGE